MREEFRLIFRFSPDDKSWELNCPCCECVGFFTYDEAGKLGKKHATYHANGWVGTINIKSR